MISQPSIHEAACISNLDIRHHCLLKTQLKYIPSK